MARRATNDHDDDDSGDSGARVIQRHRMRLSPSGLMAVFLLAFAASISIWRPFTVSSSAPQPGATGVAAMACDALARDYGAANRDGRRQAAESLRAEWHRRCSSR